MNARRRLYAHCFASILSFAALTFSPIEVPVPTIVRLPKSRQKALR